jgi:predicted DNA-binding protein
MLKDNKTYSIRLPQHLASELKNEAGALGQTFSGYVTRIITGQQPRRMKLVQIRKSTERTDQAQSASKEDSVGCERKAEL